MCHSAQSVSAPLVSVSGAVAALALVEQEVIYELEVSYSDCRTSCHRYGITELGSAGNGMSLLCRRGSSAAVDKAVYSTNTHLQ